MSAKEAALKELKRQGVVRPPWFDGDDEVRLIGTLDIHKLVQAILKAQP